jgi:hypothetical protein
LKRSCPAVGHGPESCGEHKEGDVTSPVSVRKYARIAGALFLLSFVAGGFGEAYVPSRLVVSADAAATARNIVESARLFRLGFAGYLVEALCDVGLTWILYVLLRPVHRDLALLAAFFRLISTAGFAMAEVLYFGAIRILGGADYLKTFSPDQLNTLALLSVKVSAFGQGVFSLFYGVASVLLGYLIFRSSFLPRVLGVLLALGGLGFVTSTVLSVLAPAYASPLFMFPTVVAGLLLTLWLLVKGVDVSKWQESVALAEDRGA